MDRQWLKTHCARFDHGGCGLKVLVDKGKGIRVLPDETNKRSKGYACAKGIASLERIYHPERLLYPLKRNGERGEGRWERISWDQALEYAAGKLNRIKKESGSQAVAFGQGAPKGPEYLMLMRLANFFGTPNLVTTGHVCHWPREFMGRMTCGFLPVPDYKNPTECVMLWGSNPFHTNEEGILGVHLKTSLMRSRPKLIVIDPYRTEIAKEADLWLQIRPGTDDLLALGFLHIIINEQLYDENFVKEWTMGFELLKEHIQAYTPQMVSQGTWVSEEKVFQAARLYAEAGPAIIHWGNAVENNGINTSQACRSLVILMAVTGNLDVPGGNIDAAIPPVMSLRKFIGIDHSPEKIKRSLRKHYGVSPRLPFVPSSLLIKTILEDSPYQVKALFIQGSNPLITYAGSQMVLEAIRKLEFFMISENFMTPTAAMADLVFPAATNMEYNDIGHYGLAHGYVLARPKILAPQGECRSDMEIINELAKRLGLGKYFWGDIQQCLEEIVAPSGLDYEQFRRQGILEGEKKFYKYREEGFRTPSGRVEIYSSIFKKGGYNPLPTANSPEKTDADYPLIMINSKPKNFFHSGYRHIESLRRKHGEPMVRIHPQTASEHEIAAGDKVALISAYGRIHLKAELSEALNRNVVKADYGWWFPEKGENELFAWKESNINILTSGNPPYDPILGTTPLRSIPCRIERADKKGRVL
ncbi:MAG: molybdopterin-dependent oxidoreductase [Deltaproteobacteria bacterium]|nr:molybdopterin-dependent oxidoreductase [Deltaproteobacteria bacterium]